MSFTRIAARVAALSIAVITSIAGTAVPARASAPAVGSPAPGYARMKLGTFEVTALSDGYISLPLDKLLTGLPPTRIDAALGRVFLKEPVSTSVNAYLINTGAKLVLIDTGSGNLNGPTLGALTDNLKAAGYAPDQVDEIYITHFHGDHVGGLTAADGTAVYPNAIVRADAREAGYWLSEANANKAPAAMKQFFDGARKSLAPYVSSGRYKPFTAPAQLMPGISAISTIGHTPGHASYVVTSGGQRLVLWGDLIHAGAIQFPDPDVAIGFDSTPAAAIAQRKRMMADAAAHGDWVGASHLAFPGLGHIARSGATYTWIPANYAPVIGATK